MATIEKIKFTLNRKAVELETGKDSIFQINKEAQWEAHSTLGYKVDEGEENIISLSFVANGLDLLRAENKVMKIVIQ